MLDRPRPCAAEQKVRRWKVHQKSLQVWAAAANDPAVSSCRRQRKRMAPRMTPQRTGCSPHSFQITIHHLLWLCSVASVCFFPADLEEGGQTPRLKRWSQRYPCDCKFDQQCKRVYSPTQKIWGMMMENKRSDGWLPVNKQAHGWWVERGHPLVCSTTAFLWGIQFIFVSVSSLIPFKLIQRSVQSWILALILLEQKRLLTLEQLPLSWKHPGRFCLTSRTEHFFSFLYWTYMLKVERKRQKQ